MRPASLVPIVFLSACTGRERDTVEGPEGELVDGVCVYPLDETCPPDGCADLAAALASMRNMDTDMGAGYELWRCGEGSSWQLRWWDDPYLFDVYSTFYDASGTNVAIQHSYDYSQECGDAPDSVFTVQYGDVPACGAFCLYEATAPIENPCVGGSAPPE